MLLSNYDHTYPVLHILVNVNEHSLHMLLLIIARQYKMTARSHRVAVWLRCVAVSEHYWIHNVTGPIFNFNFVTCIYE